MSSPFLRPWPTIEAARERGLSGAVRPDDAGRAPSFSDKLTSRTRKRSAFGPSRARKRAANSSRHRRSHARSLRLSPFEARYRRLEMIPRPVSEYSQGIAGQSSGRRRWCRPENDVLVDELPDRPCLFSAGRPGRQNGEGGQAQGRAAFRPVFSSGTPRPLRLIMFDSRSPGSRVNALLAYSCGGGHGFGP